MHIMNDHFEPAVNAEDLDGVVSLIPEECQDLHGAEFLVENNAFKFYHPHFNLFGTGFSVEEAARSLYDQIQDRKK